jgi:hypothetical protein
MKIDASEAGKVIIEMPHHSSIFTCIPGVKLEILGITDGQGKDVSECEIVSE